jgi:hypothetical protein
VQCVVLTNKMKAIGRFAKVRKVQLECCQSSCTPPSLTYVKVRGVPQCLRVQLSKILSDRGVSRTTHWIESIRVTNLLTERCLYLSCSLLIILLHLRFDQQPLQMHPVCSLTARNDDMGGLPAHLRTCLYQISGTSDSLLFA